MELNKNIIAYPIRVAIELLQLQLLKANEQAAAEKQLAIHVPIEVNAGNAIQLRAAPIAF